MFLEIDVSDIQDRIERCETIDEFKTEVIPLLKDEREAGREEGIKEGTLLGERKKLKEMVIRKLEQGDSKEKIAADFMEDISVIEQIVEDYYTKR